MNMKKIMSAAVAGVLCAGMFTGCSSDSSTAEQSSSDFKASSDITVISREDGSGTRGAFIELFGVEQKNDAGEKVDYTVESASVTQSTGANLSDVAADFIDFIMSADGQAVIADPPSAKLAQGSSF